jgi:hypothetical protein
MNDRHLLYTLRTGREALWFDPLHTSLQMFRFFLHCPPFVYKFYLHELSIAIRTFMVPHYKTSENTGLQSLYGWIYLEFGGWGGVVVNVLRY